MWLSLVYHCSTGFELAYWCLPVSHRHQLIKLTKASITHNRKQEQPIIGRSCFLFSRRHYCESRSVDNMEWSEREDMTLWKWYVYGEADRVWHEKKPAPPTVVAS